jgi:hypothetical protein
VTVGPARRIWLAVSVAVLLSLGTSSQAAWGVTYANSTPITIPSSGDAYGDASPYPSKINFSGLSGVVSKVRVTLFGFGHTHPDDVGMALVSPRGQSLMLLDGATPVPFSDLTVGFDDSAPDRVPHSEAWGGGVFKPTNFYGDYFPPPGPGAVGNPGPYGGGTATLASAFNGIPPNGDWSLFVRDFVSGDSGQISGGWALELSTKEPAASPVQPPATPAALGATKRCKRKRHAKRHGRRHKRCKHKARKHNQGGAIR